MKPCIRILRGKKQNKKISNYQIIKSKKLRDIKLKNIAMST
jgi:DNA-binding protein